MPNYLHLIRKYQNTGVGDRNCRFLVSGTDTQVRNTVLHDVLADAHQQNLQIVIVDNTHSGIDISKTSKADVVSVTSGAISLCSGLFDIDSLEDFSSLSEILSVLGFDPEKILKLRTYLYFVKNTESRLGNHNPITVETLEEYGAVMLVEYKLQELASTGKISDQEVVYLLSRYSEVSSAAADLDHALALIAPFLGEKAPQRDQIVIAPLGVYSGNEVLCRLICRMLVLYIRKNLDAAVVILDDGDDGRGAVIDLLRLLPTAVPVHLFSKNVFNLPESDLSAVMNRFPVRIYSRHEEMSSCGKVSECCGEVEVVKSTRSVARDRRLRANSPIDILFNLSKTETESTTAPIREPKFRKEEIQAMPPGSGILDYAGNKSMVWF